MVRHIYRESGEFKVDEGDFLNFYFELIYNEVAYANTHIQLATPEKFAYCHVYVKRFTAGIAKEIKRDWAVIKEIIRAFGVEIVIGTKIDGIRLWKKFVQLIGFKEEDIRSSIIDNKPCMMAVMEL